MKDKPQHAPMDQFPIIDGELNIGGIPIFRLAERVGQTPFYAYDRDLITNKVRYLRDSLPSDIHIHYAIKANPMPAVVQHLAGLVDGFDLASSGEMKIALDTSMPSSKISFAGPGKTDQELRQALAAEVVINIESEGEMRRIAQLAEETGFSPRIAIRVNPDFELKSSGMRMGGGPKQFGIDAERIPTVLEELKQLNLDFHGFHIFWGSQNLNTEAIIEAHKKTFDLAIQLSEQSLTQPKLLNIGGGLGIPYFPGEKRLDLTPIGEHLEAILPGFRKALPETEIATELGRYIVGEAGIYVCRIIDIKESRGEKFLVTDGGLHHHLAASGNFGQVIRKNYPVSVISNNGPQQHENATIVGPLCTPLDLLGNKMELAIAKEGDLVVVFQSGAYGFTASPQLFLSHKPPVEVLV